MKRSGNLFEGITSIENIRQAARIAMRGKGKSKAVRKFLENEESNIRKIKGMLEDKTFTTSPYKTFTIFETKERQISELPFFPDRIIHHALMLRVGQTLENTFTSDTYSCIKRRGIHKASYTLRKYLRDIEGTKYCLKLDIRKYFESIDKEILKSQVTRKIKDKDVLWLMDDIIDCYPKGIPLGNYTSQPLSNLYLTGFDHWVKETLKVKYYLHYCDDMVFLSGNKEELHEWFRAIKTFLNEKLKLKVKGNHQIFPVEVRGIDWVGYVHYHTHTLLRKSIKKRYVKSNNKKDYNSWLVHCDSINLRRKHER